ncbi:hypothetical protein K491DRAFT_614626 [Lophiostoma macrostomum CBS 122681]|uniref:Uncharacterized protein n=1 Tax=Lophiostoma macrostomum CBS 122681 TaxID=1314788 RepID=A0A6A6SM20_9PLEO|nr:hypothetical protein K491DRAFT_614626 [Lophiostoma macrostomum CBS 122681]
MATTRPDSYAQRLISKTHSTLSDGICAKKGTLDWCSANSIDQPQWQDYSDPRGVRTAWSSGVVVQGREYRATLWRDYRFLDHSREEAAEIAYKALVGVPSSSAPYARGYGSSR